jgi:Ca-activated chloride channel family protein
MILLVLPALAFAVIIPIILLLYFMRPKRQERVIGSVLLWQQALQDLQASRPWQRLRMTPLLLLQLLAALFIIIVLTRPAIFYNSPINGNTIIILQASASMQATDVAPNRFEIAKNNIADFIDQLGPNDRLSLITMSQTPQVLIAESQDKNLLNAALQRAKVTNQDADLEQALSLALSLAEGHAGTQVLVIGDGHVMNPDVSLVLPIPVRYLSIGTDTPNMALLALSSRTIQGNLIAFAQVANYSHSTSSIPVELYADSHLVGVQTVTLPAGARGAIRWGPLAPGTRFLHARMVTHDTLTADNEAWSIVGGSMRGRVLLVTNGNQFLETALRLQSNINLFETTPAHYIDIGTYDLTVFDAFVPPKLPNGNLFFVNPPPGPYLFGTSSQEVSISHINIGKDDKNLLNNVDLGSVHVLHLSHRLQPASWTQSIITAPETPLFIAGENNNRRIAVLGFDLHNTDLPLQPAFPILIQNLANWFLPPPVAAAADGQVVAGLPVTIQTWPGATNVAITGPNQHSTVVGPPFPVVPFAATDQMGVYTVTQQVRGQTLQGAFTVNLFNATQSHLTPAKALPVVNSTSFTTTGNGVSHQLREIWPWIAALLLLILCAEWWLFSRSYRVTSEAHHNTSENQRGRGKVSSTSRFSRIAPKPTFITSLQDQVQEQYRLARKFSRKMLKRRTPIPKGTKSTLKQRYQKEDKHVNI